jgi:hypothetical protein
MTDFKSHAVLTGDTSSKGSEAQTMNFDDERAIIERAQKLVDYALSLWKEASYCLVLYGSTLILFIVVFICCRCTMVTLTCLLRRLR